MRNDLHQFLIMPHNRGMPGDVIRVENLVKKFGPITAVDGIQLDVQAGQIFGFLGPNGAGKSTTIKILATLLKPTSGKASVAGFDVLLQPTEVRQSIGLVFQDQSLDDRLTAEENLWFHAMLYDLPSSIFKDRLEEVLRLVDLIDRRKSLVKTFSGGMKRRLEIARGLLHHPKVLFLDEPTLGLDPQTRNAIWKHVKALREAKGSTVFMTTHYMEEAEHCDKIAIIDNGKIQAVDTPMNLKRMVGGDKIIVGGDEGLLEDLKTSYNVDAQKIGSEIHFQMDRGAEFIPRLVSQFAGRIKSIQVKEPSLEDVFLRLTGHSIRADEGKAVDQMRQAAQLWRRGRR
jgi:ABC-2 type transport system ATP-binding protein